MAELRSRLTASAQALRDSLVGASAELESAELNAKITAITDAMEEATSAKTAVQEARKGKPKPDEQKEEDDVDALVNDATTVLTDMEAAKKKFKDLARQNVMKAAMKAAPYTGDKAELESAVEAAVAAGVAEKDLADAQNKLNAMLSFHKMLSTATEDLVEAAKGDALAIEVAALEEKITECKENAMASLKKIVVELYLQLLSKPAPTAVATEALDASIEEAKALEVDEATIKAMKKRSDEAKKAQNAKKIADRKAKKPPADPPKPPDPPEAHPDVQTLKDALEDALAKAEAKLFEAKSAGALGAASSPELLTADALQDLDTRARGEAHPTLAALEAAVKTATEAQASKSIIAQGQKALDDATALRLATRTALAKSRLEEAAAKEFLETDVKLLGSAIEVAEKEAVEEAVVTEKKTYLYNAYKAQSESQLEPLARPEELSHEGFAVIDPLRAALEEAKKRGGYEDLVLKGQAKLDFWLQARDRRDKAKVALDKSLSPPPVTVDLGHVAHCLTEATDAKLDPVLLKEAQDKEKVAQLAQRVYAKSRAAPGKLAIDVLEEELEAVGGGTLGELEAKRDQAAKRVAELQDKIDAIKVTQEAQKARDAAIAKEVKKRPTKQKKESRDLEPMTPAWVRAGVEEAGGSPSTIAKSVSEQQAQEKAELEAELVEAKEALKGSEDDVKRFGETVVVPPDVVAYAQLKLKASKVCNEMQQAQVADLLVLDIPRLQKAISASEYKFGVLPINGLKDEFVEGPPGPDGKKPEGLECSIPKEELVLARNRLRDASKAQMRLQKARTQLRVRVEAPTGTATFDLLVKLVQEAKDAGVEQNLIDRAELKLKKMEELAASSLRAGPLAFLSFHLPCLRPLVSAYAISLVEQAEEKRKEDFHRQVEAAEALARYVGTWTKGTKPSKELLQVDKKGLQDALHTAAVEGLSQDQMELPRLKLAQIEKYERDKAAGLIKDEEEERRKEAAAAAAAAAAGGPVKKKFKNYGYVKPKPEEAEAEGGG